MRVVNDPRMTTDSGRSTWLMSHAAPIRSESWRILNSGQKEAKDQGKSRLFDVRSESDFRERLTNSPRLVGVKLAGSQQLVRPANGFF